MRGFAWGTAPRWPSWSSWATSSRRRKRRKRPRRKSPRKRRAEPHPKPIRRPAALRRPGVFVFRGSGGAIRRAPSDPGREWRKVYSRHQGGAGAVRMRRIGLPGALQVDQLGIALAECPLEIPERLGRTPCLDRQVRHLHRGSVFLARRGLRLTEEDRVHLSVAPFPVGLVHITGEIRAARTSVNTKIAEIL